MFTVVLISVVLILILVFAAFSVQLDEAGPQTSKARKARKIIMEMTSGNLDSAKAKIRETVRERLPELVKRRNAGIYIGRDGIPNASEWNAHCQYFMDNVVLPILTHQERVEVLASGLSSLATELVENVVRAETQRLEKAGYSLPDIRNFSGSDSYRTDVPAVTATSPIARLSVHTSAARTAGRGRITRGLIIRSEPIEKILSGTKTWEMRSRPVEIRETIALVKKGSKAVYGVADIVDCRGPLTPSERLANERYHGVSPDRWSDPDMSKYEYAWVLANVRRLKHPVPYVHKGGVQFETLDESASAQIEWALG